MRIDGKALAEEHLSRLKAKVKKLKEERGVTPLLVIIRIGENPDSESYIRQKRRAAEKIGVGLLSQELAENVSFHAVAPVIRQARLDPKVHGILIQLPLPSHLEAKSLIELIPANQDVDGLGERSLMLNPTAAAVLNVLSYIYSQENKIKNLGMRLPVYKRLSDLSQRQQAFLSWLKKQEIVLLGTGPTAGRPIAEAFSKRKISILVCNTKTPNIRRLTKRADIVISAIGQPEFVKGRMLKKEAIVIGVGQKRLPMKKGPLKIVGDLEEDSVAPVASYYTPTPGGIGPLAVVALMDNLVTAARRQSLSRS